MEKLLESYHNERKMDQRGRLIFNLLSLNFWPKMGGHIKGVQRKQKRPSSQKQIQMPIKKNIQKILGQIKI